MKLNSTLLLAVFAATLALTSCSAEPSDWRPDEKVSIDLVAPGTRVTENFDHSVPSGSIEDVHSPLMEAAEAEATGPHHQARALSRIGHFGQCRRRNAQARKNERCRQIEPGRYGQ